MARRSQFFRGAAAIAAAGIVAAGVAACGSSSSDGSSTSTSAGNLTTLTMDSIPTIDYAEVAAGVQQGFFKQHGINLKFSTVGDVSTIPPALISNEVQVAAWSIAAMGNVAAAHLPLVVVAPLDQGPTTTQSNPSQLLVLKSSGITSAKQLEGKTVAINGLGSITQLQVYDAVKNAGGKPSTIKPVQIPFAEMQAALSAGRVAAIGSNEPFTSKIEESLPVRSIAGLDYAVQPGLPLTCLAMNKTYVNEHPALVRQFQEAVQETEAYLTGHPDALRAVLPSFAGITPQLAQKVTLPVFTTSENLPAEQLLLNELTAAGVVHVHVDISQYVLPYPLPANWSASGNT
jgi:NitT/TauT family transport system substrate-binding protein